MRLKQTLIAALMVAGLAVLRRASAQATIKSVLHPLSGTMAISETTLKDTVLMLIDRRTRKAAFLGKKLSGRRSASDPLFAEKPAGCSKG